MAENRMMNACAAGGMNKGYVNMCGRRFIKAGSYSVQGTSAMKQAEDESVDFEQNFASDYEVLKALWSVSRPSVFGKIKTTIKALYRAFMVEFFALDIVEQL